MDRNKDRKSAVILLYESLWFVGKLCYDIRLYDQAMPGGCVVVGLIVSDEGEFSQDFIPPRLANPRQNEQWKAVVAYCQKIVSGEKVEMPVLATKEQEKEEVARLQCVQQAQKIHPLRRVDV